MVVKWSAFCFLHRVQKTLVVRTEMLPNCDHPSEGKTRAKKRDNNPGLKKKKEGPARVLPRDLWPKKKPTQRYPSFCDLWPKKKPTPRYPSFCDLSLNKKATRGHPSLFRPLPEKKSTWRYPSFLPTSEREEAYLGVPFFSSDFEARRSLPGGTLLLYRLVGEKKPTWGYPSSLRTSAQRTLP